MDIINTFYGAFLGIWATWLTSEVFKIEELSLGVQWIVFIIIGFAFMAAYILQRFSKFPRLPKGYKFLLPLICVSPLPSIVPQIISNPDIATTTLFLSPMSWLFSLIIGGWALTIRRINK